MIPVPVDQEKNIRNVVGENNKLDDAVKLV